LHREDTAEQGISGNYGKSERTSHQASYRLALAGMGIDWRRVWAVPGVALVGAAGRSCVRVPAGRRLVERFHSVSAAVADSAGRGCIGATLMSRNRSYPLGGATGMAVCVQRKKPCGCADQRFRVWWSPDVRHVKVEETHLGLVLSPRDLALVASELEQG
jgi:hypothetical protein